MTTIPLCRLRAVLNESLDGAGTVIRRCREAGLLPLGGGGRDGVNSARLDARHVAMTLLAVASTSWVEPCAAPAEAERLANFKLRGRDEVLLDVFAGAIAAAAAGIEGYAPSSWSISRHRVRQEALDLTFSDGAPGRDSLVRTTIIMPGVIDAAADLFRAAA